MIGPSRIIKNNSEQEVTIVELGQVILAGAEVDLLHSYAADVISRCDSLMLLIASGAVIFNDGLRDYEAVEALRVLMDLHIIPSVDEHGYQQISITGNALDYDSKIVVHSSPRPLSPKTYTHFMGASDNLETSLHGEGSPFRLTVSGNQASEDYHFLSDSQVYMRGAFFAWENAAWGTELTAELVGSPSLIYSAPSNNFLTVDQYNRIHLNVASGTYSWAATPVPVPALDANENPCGYWNVINDSLEYVPTASGAYDLYTTERLVAKFVQRMQVYKTNYAYITLGSDDVEYIPPGYFFRIAVTNPEVHDELVDGSLVTVSGYQICRFMGTFYTYRQDTLP